LTDAPWKASLASRALAMEMVFGKRVNHWLTRTEADPPEPKDMNHAI
jgi:hypothetical protein